MGRICVALLFYMNTKVKISQSDSCIRRTRMQPAPHSCSVIYIHIQNHQHEDDEQRVSNNAEAQQRPERHTMLYPNQKNVDHAPNPKRQEYDDDEQRCSLVVSVSVSQTTNHELQLRSALRIMLFSTRSRIAQNRRQLLARTMPLRRRRLAATENRRRWRIMLIITSPRP